MNSGSLFWISPYLVWARPTPRFLPYAALPFFFRLSSCVEVPFMRRQCSTHALPQFDPVACSLRTPPLDPTHVSYHGKAPPSRGGLPCGPKPPSPERTTVRGVPSGDPGLTSVSRPTHEQPCACAGALEPHRPPTHRATVPCFDLPARHAPLLHPPHRPPRRMLRHPPPRCPPRS